LDSFYWIIGLVSSTSTAALIGDEDMENNAGDAMVSAWCHEMMEYME
jgi:hypothetical protein